MSLLSIVLPAYNEEQNIANTAKVLGELLEQHGIDYELVFISDGSKDGTFERIKEESAKNPLFKKIYASWAPFRNNEARWMSIAEAPLERFMQANPLKVK
mgnify:CR=1 FL=1